MFWMGLILGLFIGANLGVIIMALCVVASRADRQPADSVPDRFLLFEGWEYASCGGMHEYIGAFADLQSAIEYTGRTVPYKRDWAHIAAWIDDKWILILECLPVWKARNGHVQIIYRQWRWLE